MAPPYPPRRRPIRLSTGAPALNSSPRIPVWIALLPVLLAAVGPASTRASELGPNRWGLPGLGQTFVVPDAHGAPLRLGLWADTATLDAEHGIAVDLGTRDLRSRSLRLSLSVRASNNVMLGASLPYRFVSEENGISVDGLGDAQVGGVVRLLHIGRWRMGSWILARLPSGDAAKGLSTDEVETEWGMTVTGSFFEGGVTPEMRWHLNVGYRANKNETTGYGTGDGDFRDVGVFFPSYPASGVGENGRRNDEILLRTAVEFQRRWGHLFLELSTDWLFDHPDAEFAESASWLTPGLHLGREDGVALTAAWAIGLFADQADTAYEPRLPDWHLQLGLSMPIFVGGRDRDEDGVVDEEDACPDRPEDLDGYQDEDGCPDPDNDGDGILDRYDLAPDLAEDFDGFEDLDGRPDLDNDNDGIADDRDACPLRPEDFDGVEDEDGCPDVVLDADGDGILDSEDDCPGVAEDLDGFEDSDGCPEEDNDLDGIPDDRDACPLEAEDYDGFEDDDGCPEESGGTTGR